MANLLMVDGMEDDFADVLRCHGHDVEHCWDADTARRRVTELRPDALIVRLRGTPPHVRDFDALLALPAFVRGQPETAGVRLVAIGHPSGAGRFVRGIALAAGYDRELHVVLDSHDLHQLFADLESAAANRRASG
jgi:hypothetical protein